MFHGDGIDPGDKVANYFYHPMNTTYNKQAEVEFQLQIGSSVYPQYHIRSLAEAFYSLRTQLLVLQGRVAPISATGFHS